MSCGRTTLLGIISLAAVIAAPARAQSTQLAEVIPTSATNVEGAGHDSRLFRGESGRMLFVIDRRVLQVVHLASIGQIRFRRDLELAGSLPEGWQGGSLDVEVHASWTTQSANAPTSRFADNHSTRRKVFAGRVVFPTPDRSLNRGLRGASFAKAQSISIVLDQRLRPAPSGNLCLELAWRRVLGKKAPQDWFVDRHRVGGGGSTQAIGVSCWQRDANPIASCDATRLWPGGSASFVSFGPRSGTAVLLLGVDDRRFGPLRLPLGLDPIAPGCELYLAPIDARSVLLRSPHPSYPQGEASTSVVIPAIPAFASARLLAQWAFVETSARAPRLYTSNMVEARIAARPSTLGVGLVVATRWAAERGEVFVDRSPVLWLAR